MAAFAGILIVKLEKKGEYALGKTFRDPGPSDIRVGHNIAQVTGGLALLSVAAVLAIQSKRHESCTHP
jgi:cobalamin biosynthesis protein CobD/CbiB